MDNSCLQLQEKNEKIDSPNVTCLQNSLICLFCTISCWCLCRSLSCSSFFLYPNITFCHSCWISSLPLDFMFSDWTILNLTTHVDAGVLAQFNAFQSHSLYLAPSRLKGLLFLYGCVSFDCSAFSFHFMYLWFTIRERFQSPIVYFNIYYKCASFQCTRLTHATERHVCKNPLIGKNLLSCCFQHDFDWMPMSFTPTCALTPFKTFIHSVCGMATNWCNLLSEFSSRFQKQPSSNCFLVMLSISVFIKWNDKKLHNGFKLTSFHSFKLNNNFVKCK